MLVGVPLGVASRRGGKSSGFVFTILLVFVYYFLSSTGIALGPPEQAAGFPGGVVGQHAVCRGGHLSAVADGDRRADSERHRGMDCAAAETSGSRRNANGFALTELARQAAAARDQAAKTRPRGIFPRILDEYIVREFVTMFLLVLAGFVLL